MTTTFIDGALSTGNILQDQREVDFSKAVDELDPNVAPLTQFTRRLNKRATVSPEFSWFEDEGDPRFDAIDEVAGYNSSDNPITVDNGAYFRPQDLVRNTATEEVFRVISVSGDDLTVKRGVGSTAASMSNDDELMIIGSARMEGDTSRSARAIQPVKVTNYTGIVRSEFEVTGTMQASKTRTSPHEFKRLAAKAGREHRKDLELVFILSVPSEDLTGTNPRRTTGGAFYYVTQNTATPSSPLDQDDFFAALSPTFRHGSKTKLGLASRQLVDILNGFGRSKLELVQSDMDKTFGVSIFRYVSPHGVLNLATHWLFEGEELSGDMLILDVEELAYRYLAGEGESRDTKLLTNRQANDADGRKDEYLTEAGLEFGQPKCHGSIRGVTS